MSRKDEFKAWNVEPSDGGFKMEAPDGVNIWSDGKYKHSLYDNFDRPMIQSGDQKTIPTRYMPNKGRITE